MTTTSLQHPDDMAGIAEGIAVGESDALRQEAPDEQSPLWERIITRLSSVSAILAGLSIVVLGLQIVLDAGGRTLFNSPVPGTLELVSNWWMVIAVFLGFAFTQFKGEHIRVTLLIEKLPVIWSTAVETVILALSFIMISFLAYYLTLDAIQSVKVREIVPGSFPLALWPITVLMAFGMWLYAAQILVSITSSLRAAKREKQSGAEQLPLLSAQNVMLGISVVVSIVITICVLAVPMSRVTTGTLLIVLMVLLLLCGLTTALAMIVTAALGLWEIVGMPALVEAIESVSFHSAASWSLSVVPMFVLMGIVLWRTGLTAKVFYAARLWLGGMPGGLAVATNFSGAGLAAASGSTIGISYALGRMAIPEMLRAGYKPSLATGVVAMAGTLGQLIPPSVLLVVYAGVAAVPVGPQLTAAILPGIIVAVLYALVIIIQGLVRPDIAPRAKATGVPMKVKLKALVGIIPLVVVIFIVIFGMLSGIFTATEAGAFGALAAIVVGSAFGEERKNPKQLFKKLGQSLQETVTATAGIFLLLIGVNMLGRSMTMSGVLRTLTDWVVSLGMPTVVFLLAIMVLFLILGMFMESMSIILLAVPILAPVLIAMDVDMLWFGIFVVMLIELALVTPPVGMLTFIVHRLAQDKDVNLGQKISLIDVFKGVMPFVFTSITFIIVLIFFPEISTWLPGNLDVK
ncbi:TRAP transporter large permease subunit [Leucobacter denitrificans]|uniref:TRAP transporter large permease subunit n=1 Tax=Leucobacter denitrificans TaxID=683042 RepID=A0A7G9S565_9MICO|nr:TRAP transporter large permease subunit [Leucobacter denitrificans]QNN62990.1 TRAP transporter large permease subunit [Leucobacter denitrificans]